MEVRNQICEILAEIRRLNPSLRFGQLVVNISYLAKGWTKSAAWDVEDEEFLSAATSYLESLKRLEPNPLPAQAALAQLQEKQREAVTAEQIKCNERTAKSGAAAPHSDTRSVYRCSLSRRRQPLGKRTAG